MSFFKKKQETFKTGKLDIIVIIGVAMVFYFALFCDSFVPLKNETGEIVYDYKGEPITKFNFQVIMASLILCYEMLLMLLEGKKRGRYLPWWLYYRIFLYKIYLKIDEGKKLTKEYFENKKVK